MRKHRKGRSDEHLPDTRMLQLAVKLLEAAAALSLKKHNFENLPAGTPLKRYGEIRSKMTKEAIILHNEDG